MNQPDLFPDSTPYRGLPPYVRGSQTSQEAAQSMLELCGPLERKVMELLLEAGEKGLTDDEIEAKTGMRHQTASARRRTLELKGLVKKTENKRRTRSGRFAAVYVTRAT